jgi:hypothetical protein
MAVNRDKPDRWKSDIAASVDFYNQWFLTFAPQTFRDARADSVEQVRQTISLTEQMKDFSPEKLYRHPEVLGVLRMCTAPPLARDRLVGLAGVRKHLVEKMEKENVIPPSYTQTTVLQELGAVANVVQQMLDRDIFIWIEGDRQASDDEEYRAATVIADRLTGAVSDPIIRNAQERRQLDAIVQFLKERAYTRLDPSARGDWQSMPPGTYALRLNVPVTGPTGRKVNIPVDMVIQPKTGDRNPLLIEAKSAGDFTNTNKRRKEEAQKMNQLRDTYGDDVRYLLFLCGYFDSGYLGYEAAEGIDWVWEHRIEDLEDLGI